MSRYLVHLRARSPARPGSAGASPPRLAGNGSERVGLALGAPLSPDTARRIEAQRGAGAALMPAERAFFEPRLGHRLGDVRIHADAGAAELSARVSARAFAVGRDVFFGAGEYRPGTPAGRLLIAHELAHGFQHGAADTLRRDLKAYDRTRTEVLPSDPTGMSSTSVEQSAEAPGLRSALQELIDAGKLKEVHSGNGRTSWFAPVYDSGVTRDEVRGALDSAGYGKAAELSAAIFDKHAEFLYSNRTMTTITLFYTRSTTRERLSEQTSRSMTEWEIGEARTVFGSAIDYADVTVEHGSISSELFAVGGRPRTVGNTVSIPEERSVEMPLLIHELTHVWQYQKSGWTYAPKALWAQATEGYGYASGGKSAEGSLLEARKSGRTFFSFNQEQQGNILRDYYRRTRNGDDVAAWQPFVNDVKGS